MTEFTIEYLRPDGWERAGDGYWMDREAAEEDARAQLPRHVKWRVVELPPEGED